ncbi:MAG: phosphoglycerate dehydrogenase [Chloroflexi bacterium]|jgi:D-3-phosphoglycerate dehydrogenase / 2-oxoglutarate reductase|nr:phosphoglycerate dehydrogenase [Chloroflexota bacterium]
MTFHILITDQLDSPGRAILHAVDDVIISGPFETRAEILAALPEADAVIVRASTRVDAEFLAAAQKLQVIARAGERIENIDVEAATHRGILVLNVPDVNVTAVVEHTFGLLLSLARSIPAGHNAMRRGEWPRHEMRGFLLAGKTLGIIGFGQTGRAVAIRAQAFDINVLVYDPYIDLSFARQQGVEIVNFPELLARADILSLHTAYSAQTHAIMDADAFTQMKSGSYLINCTHPGLIDETALVQTLENGTLAGAALDQFSVEPPPPDAPLRLHPKVLVTPHLGENTVESQRQTSVQIAEDTLAALRGEDYRNVVNLPFTPETPYHAVRPYIHLASKLGKLQGQLADGWITRIEVELLGEGLDGLIRPVAAVLLKGLLRPVDCCTVNWVSAPMLAHEQGITTAQVKGLVDQADYPNLIACKIYWEGGERIVAGVLFGNGEARLVQYDQFEVDAYPEGYVLILENDDIPGVIGKVGDRLGRGKINVAQWRYGRERPGGQAVSFINIDDPVPATLRAEFESEPEIRRARLVHL